MALPSLRAVGRSKPEASLRSFGLLDVSKKGYALFGVLSRKPRIQNHLGGFASTDGEKSGLKGMRKNLRNAARILNSRLSNTAFFGPHIVALNIAETCDDHCVFCPVYSHYSTSPPTNTDRFFLSVSRIDALLSTLKTMAVQRVSLGGRGEPLFHPQITHIISSIVQNGLEVFIRTNGIGLREKVGSLSSNASITYAISVHAANPETWVTIHKGKKEEGFLRLLDYVRAMPMPVRRNVSFSNVLCKLNYEEAPEMLQLAHRVGIREVEFQMLVDGELTDEGKKRMRFTKADKPLLQRKLMEAHEIARKARIRTNLAYILHSVNSHLDMGEDQGGVFPPRIPSAIPCHIGHWFSRIMSDGRVLPCCGCTESLGNITESTFQAIWNSDENKLFRNHGRRGKFSELKDCRCWECIHLRTNLRIHRLLHPFSIVSSADRNRVSPGGGD